MARPEPARTEVRRGVFQVEDMAVPYVVIRSLRATHARLRFPARGHLEVVLPSGTNVRWADSMLHAHADWIRRQVARRGGAEERVPRHGDRLKWRGGSIGLEIVGDGSAAAPHGDVLRCRVEAGTDVNAVLERWYRRQARMELAREVQDLAPRLGVTPGRLSVRDQATRWGSCSSSGALSFNWRLVLAPPEILRYVVIHELAHLRQRNHGPHFWALVGQHCPDHALHRRWLRDHGHTLTSLLAP